MISVEKLIFSIVLNIAKLSYKPLNFAQANRPSAAGQRVKRIKARIQIMAKIKHKIYIKNCPQGPICIKTNNRSGLNYNDNQCCM